MKLGLSAILLALSSLLGARIVQPASKQSFPQTAIAPSGLKLDDVNMANEDAIRRSTSIILSICNYSQAWALGTDSIIDLDMSLVFDHYHQI